LKLHLPIDYIKLLLSFSFVQADEKISEGQVVPSDSLEVLCLKAFGVHLL